MAYSKKCLRQSKGVNYAGQLKKLKSILGEEGKADERIIITLIFSFLSNPASPRIDRMRLETKTVNGYPLRIDTILPNLALGGDTIKANALVGMGASVEIK